MGSSRTNGRALPLPPLQIILWADIFAVVDEGNALAGDYLILERMVLEQANKHAGGLGGLIIIPPDASPPPEEVRRAIRQVLAKITPRLRCLCWLVEGDGFRAAAVRAVLISFRVLSRQRYATHVASQMAEAVGWTLKHLEQGKPRQSDLKIALEAIQLARRNVHAAKSSDLAML